MLPLDLNNILNMNKISYYSELYRNKKHEEFIEELISNYNFIDIEKLLTECRNIEKKQWFWTSNLPIIFCSDIFSSPLKFKYLDSYFRNATHSNLNFEKALINHSTDTYIYFFKLFKAYRKEVFLKNLNKLGNLSIALKKFTREIDYIIYTTNFLKKELEILIPIIKTIPISYFLLRFTHHYELKKQHISVKQNKGKQFEEQTHLLSILDKLIHFIIKNGVLNAESLTPEKFNREWTIQEPSHKSLGKKIIIKEHKSKLYNKKIDAIIDFLDQYIYFHNWLDYYSVDALDFNSNKKENFNFFKFNDKKHRYEDFYFQEEIKLKESKTIDYSNFFLPNKKISLTEKRKHINNDAFIKFSLQNLKSTHDSRLSINNDINYFNHLNIPLKVYFKNEILDFRDVFKLLNTFSLYKGTEEKQCYFDNNKQLSHYFIMNKPNSNFQKLFGKNVPISCFRFEDFKLKIGDYFNWDNEKTDTILDFLITDLNNYKANNTPNKITQKPFIKVHDNLYWLGSFYKDLRWQNHILNRLDDNSISIGVKKKLKKG